MSRRLKYATFCSGIECMSVACRGLPLDPVFFSEIEPFPCAVLKANYPTIPNLGDMSKIRRDENGNITNGTTTIPFPDGGIDILAAGCPCQDFSVAGKRAGGAEGSGTRSSLIFEFIRIIGEIRPRWFIYENVVGMLSTNEGRDFAHILLAFRDCGYSVAYRTLDAQYVRVDGMERAVPQRRRRVWVVGYSGADESRAAEILFEPDCVVGDKPPRRRTGEGFAYSLAGCDRVDAPVVDGAPGVGGEGVIALDGDKLKPREDQRKGGNGFGVNEEGAGYTLTAVDRHGVAYKSTNGKGKEVAATLSADDITQSGQGCVNNSVVQCYENHAQDSRVQGPIDTAPTQGSSNANSAGVSGNNPLVVMRNTPFVKTSHAKGKNGDGEKWEQCELAGTRNAIEGGDGRNQECIVSTNSNGGDVAPTISSCEYKMGQKQTEAEGYRGVCRDTEPLGIGRDVFNSGANASYSPDIRVGVQPTLTARTTQGAVCARLKGDE